MLLLLLLLQLAFQGVPQQHTLVRAGLLHTVLHLHLHLHLLLLEPC
jgi:hypothetical protein